MNPFTLRFATGVLLALLTSAGFAAVPYPGNDADSGVTRVTGLADPYTGNWPRCSTSGVGVWSAGRVAQPCM